MNSCSDRTREAGCANTSTTPMNQRLQRATQFGTQVGGWVTAVGEIRLLILRFDLGKAPLERVAVIVLAGAATFAVFFAMAFVLAFALPDHPFVRVTFPAASKIRWPIIAALVATMVYLVVALL
jgi:hypothetical protein